MRMYSPTKYSINFKKFIFLFIILSWGQLGGASHENKSSNNVVSFLSGESFIRVVGYEGSYNVNIRFKVRTWHEDGLLVFHKFSSSGHLKMHLLGGILRCEVHPGGGDVVLDQFDVLVSDGGWHEVHLEVTMDMVSISLDNLVMSQTLHRQIRTGPFYLIGGGLYNETGLIGCIDNLEIDKQTKVVKDYEVGSDTGVLLRRCDLTNKCAEVTCEHGGRCRHVPRAPHVYCDCDNTGYTGATCRTANTWRSCQQFLQFTRISSGQAVIDVDGPGPVPPSLVTCDLDSGEVVTSVGHTSMEATKVDGFQAPGSFSQTIHYSVDDSLINHLVQESYKCSQSLRYDCKQSKLFGGRTRGSSWSPYGWWVSWGGQRMDHWSGARPGSRQCGCGSTSSCVEADLACNCDSGQEDWTHDTGLLEDREYLPVSQLHFGDTGTPLDNKEARFTLGPLRCVTSPGPVLDHSLHLTSSGHRCPDIFFEFQLTSAAGTDVLYQLEDEQLVCKVVIKNQNQLVYSWRQLEEDRLVNMTVQVGGYSLHDGRWHSLNIEHNVMEVSVIVDRENTVTHTLPVIDNQTNKAGHFYLKKSDNKVNSTKVMEPEVRIRMLEVNGLKQSQWQENGDIKLEMSDTIVPMEAVHAMTNNSPITKFLPIPNLILLVSILSVIVIFILIIILGVVKYVDKNKGETYYTQEQLIQAQT